MLFASTGAVARTQSFFGRVARLSVMRDVRCTGSELTLQSCPHSTSEYCSLQENAGVECSVVQASGKHLYIAVMDISILYFTQPQ